jgi:hypothetical protein
MASQLQPQIFVASHVELYVYTGPVPGSYTVSRRKARKDNVKGGETAHGGDSSPTVRSMQGVGQVAKGHGRGEGRETGNSRRNQPPTFVSA